MFNEEKIINTLSTINETCFFDLNNIEKTLVIANLLLMEAEEFLPPELKEDSKRILSNGKRISYELLKHEDNLGLSMAMKAHIIISDINKEMDEIDD